MHPLTKKCTTCDIEQPLDSFYNLQATKDKKSYRCKTCDYAARNAYHKKHYHLVREKIRINNRKHKYGVTPEFFNEMWGVQKGKCKICLCELDQDFTTKHSKNRVVIDHCHKTKRVRGLLCTMCNKALGLLKEDSEIVKNALNYLGEIH